jgi:PAS domain S-box-containing protein
MDDKFNTIEQLKAELAEYRAIIDNSLEGIFIVQNHTLKFCNQRLAQMFGFKNPRDAIGIDVMELVSPQSRELVNRELEAHESGKKQTSHYDFFARRTDGSEFDVETLSSRIMYQGKPAVQAIIRDISKQRQLEKQLHQAQKMETIGSLASGIAHDFNNILSIIIGYAELSLDDYTSETKIKHNLEQVLSASYRAKDLAQQILSFGLQSEREKRPVKVNPIVQEVLTLIRASLPSSIHIHQNISETTYIVLADPTQLHQVLMNLCTNAGHAMQEKGGVLEVVLSDLNRDLEAISEQSLAPSPYLRLTVSDTGHGMKPEVMERIFDPFFTTKKKGEGTGMGLSVVQGIVKNLDGEISVESEVGKGTSFHLFLPIFEESEGIEEKPKKPIPRGNERILLVDDEVVLVNMGRKMLGQLGYDVVPVTESIEALETFRAAPESFDLVITDLTMPDMTGKQLARELVKIKPDIPVVVCTGFSREIKRDNIRDSGIKAFIIKPYNKEEIANIIRKVLDEKENF